jgi:hypothetical protein
MTRAMGEALARKIAKAYGEDPGSGYGPTFNDVFYGPDKPIVGWEGGPYDSHGCPWSYDCDGKVAAMAPKGWYVEAINGWAVALYPI